MELTQHPLSAAFPSMSADDFAALIEDIKGHGQREPIMLFEGKVLDGWHRYQACEQLGIKPQQFTFAGDDPVAFVLSHNLHRRHLSASQRAAAVVACAQWAPTGRPKKMEVASTFSTNKDLAKAAGTTVRTITDVKAATKAGLGEAVKDGAVTAEEGARIARGTPQKAAATPKAAAPVAPHAEDFGPDEAEIAAAQRAQEDELASLRRVADSDDKLKAALDEAKRFREENRILKERINSLMGEKNAAIQAAKRWEKKAKSLERATA
jgi:hypothetical protein